MTIWLQISGVGYYNWFYSAGLYSSGTMVLILVYWFKYLDPLAWLHN